MRCGCPNCGAYMVHSDDSHLGCVCPECLYRCKACLGTDTLLTREELLKRSTTQWFDLDSDEVKDPENNLLAPDIDGKQYVD